MHFLSKRNEIQASSSPIPTDEKEQAGGSILGPKRRSASHSSNICGGLLSPGLISPLFCSRRKFYPKGLTHVL